jgi:hypothetical protein
MKTALIPAAFALCLLPPNHTAVAQSDVELTNAVVVAPSNVSGPENKAIEMLLEEVERRTQLRWQRTTSAPRGGAMININRAPGASGLPREGYRIQTSGTAVAITGNDARGVLFGVGHLLRTMHMEKRRVTLPAPLNVVTAPRYPLRGHQLGYRPKTNSYDGWTLAMWEQYIRDLTVFGANAIELIPPRSDDAADSPHFPLPQMDTMIGMSRICEEYGLDVWVWYPAMDKDYSDPKAVAFALNEWAEVIKRLPRVDAVFVPGGDPGHTQPKYFMALLEKQTASLRRFHPKLQMWVSPQSFTAEWMDEFLGIVKTEPAWLAGIVYGPQTRMTSAQLRAAIPARYPLRHYPDITHSRQCQYPVPEWDTAYKLTEGREIINQRPTQMAQIFRVTQPNMQIGFIAYSEGCNDDVNKFMWSALGWNPDVDVIAALRDYARYFIGVEYEDAFAQGLLALERNWSGPLAANSNVATTLAEFQTMERHASPQVRLNWRFQQALYRAYYDAYVRVRLIYETALEEEALESLRGARSTGTLTAMNEAERLLDRAVLEPVARDYRARTFELGEALFQSIRMQLSVQKYQALAVGRGANLDTIDFPLNNRQWLKRQFAEIRKPHSEGDRAKMIDEILNWKNPGPGGFYDDLGKLDAQPHLVRELGFEQDPSFLQSPLASSSNYSDGSRNPRTDDFALIGMGIEPSGPLSWWDVAETFYETPLRMRYTGLDQSAKYKIRVVYLGPPQEQMRLMANDKIEVHTLIKKESRPLEFDIPQAATAGGELVLSWTQGPGSHGAGRGTQIAEVWLIKKQTSNKE